MRSAEPPEKPKNNVPTGNGGIDQGLLQRALDHVRVALEGPHETQALIESLRRTRSDLREANRRLESSRTVAAQYRLTRVLLESRDLDDAAPRIAEIIAREFEWDQALFWTESEPTYQARIIWPDANVVGRSSSFEPGRDLVETVWADPTCHWLEDASDGEDGLWGSHVAFPIYCDSMILGVLEFRSMLPRQRDPGLINLLIDMGVKIGEFTQRRRTEEELARREAENRALLDALPDTILRLSKAGFVLDYRGGQPGSDWDRHARIGQRLDALWPGLPPSLRSAIDHAFGTIHPSHVDYAIEAPGLRRDYEGRIVPLSADEVLVVIRDVTEWRQAERHLQALNLELEARVEERTQALERANEELRHISITDPLTGLYNRRHLFEQLPNEAARVERIAHDEERHGIVRRNAHLGLMLLDLDHFKAVNDNYGHDVGDIVLKQLVERLLYTTRASDSLYRWGGEEFLIVAHETEARELGTLAERIRDAVERQPFAIPGDALRLTCSIGYACHPLALPESEAVRWTWEDVLNLADQALYLAKGQGRNQHVGVLPQALSLSPAMAETLRQDLLHAQTQGLVELAPQPAAHGLELVTNP